MSIWADPLYDGPVPGGLSDEDLLEVRARHLAAPSRAAFAEGGGGDASLDAVNDLRQWRAAIQRHGSYDELVLWFEHDLFDQLNLVQLLCWLREHLRVEKMVSLVCIGSFPGHPGFKGLGELTPDELGSLLDTRRLVTEPQYAVAEIAWRAFREPTPEALDGLRGTDTSALPYLGAAIRRFLQEYPWTADGLSRTERRLLELADGGIGLAAAFPRMHDGEEFYYITDLSLAALAWNLSRSAPPLLRLPAGQAAGAHVLSRSVALTDTGRAMLAGRQDRVHTCGIDRWLGGVHLEGSGEVWRWDDSRERVVRR